MMNAEQQRAYEWAKNQNYTSVAAQYAKTLAGLVDELEAEVKRWVDKHNQVDGPCPDDTPTNADRIRGMSDEELEDGLRKIGLGYKPWCALSCVDNCNRCLLDWLHQPAETEGTE